MDLSTAANDRRPSAAFSALQFTVSPSPRDEGNAEQAPSAFNSLKKATSWVTNQRLDQLS